MSAQSLDALQTTPPACRLLVYVGRRLEECCGVSWDLVEKAALRLSHGLGLTTPGGIAEGYQGHSDDDLRELLRQLNSLDQNGTTTRLWGELWQVHASDMAACGFRQQSTPPPSSVRKSTLKAPSEDAFHVYRWRFATGQNQTDMARDTKLMELLGRQVNQGTISRWLKDVENWIAAGNILPPQPEPLDSQPRSIDPEHIDMGAPQEHRPERQRGKRNSSRDPRRRLLIAPSLQLHFADIMRAAKLVLAMASAHYARSFAHMRRER